MKKTEIIKELMNYIAYQESVIGYTLMDSYITKMEDDDEEVAFRKACDEAEDLLDEKGYEVHRDYIFHYYIKED